MDSSMTMTMPMSMSMAATSTMSGMSMATSSAEPSSSNMMTMMGMDQMAMVFFTSATTPLFSYSWTPTGAGEYTGTCIFLIAFAAIFRGLLAFRIRFHDVVAAARHRHHGSIGQELKRVGRPWRASEAVSMAGLDVMIAGVSYLLMIAVMTMNVGYFMSVLAGVFLGSMATAHIAATAAVC